MKIENKINITRINFTRTVEDNPLIEVVLKLIEDPKTDFYIEKTNKYKQVKEGNKISLSSLNLLIFNESNSFQLGVNISASTFSELFIYYVGSAKIKPRGNHIKVQLKQSSSIERVKSNKEMLEFIKEASEVLESSDFSPRMNKNAWEDFIQPYEYYRSLKLFLFKKNFFMIDMHNKHNEKEKVEVSKAYIVNNKNDSEYTFKTNHEVSKNVFVSEENTSGNSIECITHKIYVPKFDSYTDLKLKERKEFFKREGKDLEIYAIDTKEPTELTENNLEYLNRENFRRGIVGIKSMEEYNDETEINIQNSLRHVVAKRVKEISEDVSYNMNPSLFNDHINVLTKDIHNLKTRDNVILSSFESQFIEVEELAEKRSRTNKIIIDIDNQLGMIEKTLNKISDTISYYTDINGKLESKLEDEKVKVFKTEKKIENDIAQSNKNLNDIEKIKEKLSKEENSLAILNGLIESSEGKASKDDVKKRTAIEKEIAKLEAEILAETKSLRLLEGEISASKNLLSFYEESYSSLKTNIENERLANIEICNLKLSEYKEKAFEISRNISEFDNESKSIKLIEEKKVYTFKYFHNNEGTKFNDNFFYILNRQSAILLNTIFKTIKDIRNNGMNNEIVKIIADPKHKISNEKHKYVESNSKFISDGTKLNREQEIAFNIAVNPENKISVIQGPPGTGKTEVITRLVKHFRSKQQKVILSSQTNEAIRNVIDKLLSDKTGPIFSSWAVLKKTFEYSAEKMPETLYDITFEKKMERIMRNPHEEIEDSSSRDIIKSSIERLHSLKTSDKPGLYLSGFDLYKDAYMMGATTTTSATNKGSGKDYVDEADVLIIDEVSKSYLVEVLRYAPRVKKVILVGDYKQLSPLFDLRKEDFAEMEDFDSEQFDDVKSKIEKGVFYDVSKKAFDNGLNTQLVINYRSLEEILDSYKIFYSNNENSKIASKELVPFRTNESQLKRTMGEYPFPQTGNFFKKDIARYFVNIDGTKYEPGDRKSKTNLGEREYIVSILEDLLKLYDGPTSKSLGIIFMYSAQLVKFKIQNSELINKLNEIFRGGFRINTVDGFQGSESDIIIVATTVNDTEEKRTFLSNYRRINVALSRAKDVLVMLGSETYFTKTAMDRDGEESDLYMKKVIKSIKESDYSEFYEGESW